MHVAGLHSPNTRHPRRLHAQAFQALAASTVAVGLALAPAAITRASSGVRPSLSARLAPEATHQFSEETTGVTGWSAPQAIDPNDGVLASVSCPTTSFCMAVGGAALAWNGKAWSPPDLIDSNGGGLSSVSCPTTSFCMAVNWNGNAFAWNDRAWSPPDLIDPNGSQLESISCPTTSFCMAVDRSGDVPKWHRKTWSRPEKTPLSRGLAGFNSVIAVSCAGPHFCAVIGGATSTDVSAAQPPDMPYFGGFPQLAITWNGASWSPRHTLSSARAVFGVSLALSCTKPSHCVALATARAGTEMASFAWNGKAWSPPDLIDSNGGGLSSVSCPTTSFCMAVDWNGNALTWKGGEWSKPDQIDPEGYLASVSCPSARACVAVDWNGNALTWNGVRWSKPSVIDKDSLTAISCPTTRFCMAVDWDGNALTWNGDRWSKSSVIGAFEVQSVSCSTTTFCVAVDWSWSDTVFTWSDDTWSKAGIAGSHPFYSVSCPRKTFCVAVGATTAFIWGAGKWSSTGDIGF